MAHTPVEFSMGPHPYLYECQCDDCDDKHSGTYYRSEYVDALLKQIRELQEHRNAAWADSGGVSPRLIAAAPALIEALKDMLSGWRYIRETHGDLYGVGWERAEDQASAAIAAAEGE